MRVFPYFKPDYMVLTNLFRDQLDRYGEIDITMNLLKKAMQMAPDMTVIVNGDDALSAYLAMESGHPYVTYGISRTGISRSRIPMRFGRDDSASGAGSGWSMIFITTASSARTTVPTADLHGRRWILMRNTLIWRMV